jgi:hypothetical protein
MNPNGVDDLRTKSIETAKDEKRRKKNSSRDIKSLSCLDKLRFSAEVHAVGVHCFAASANDEHW